VNFAVNLERNQRSELRSFKRPRRV